MDMQLQKPEPRASIRQVAERAGVSRTTVSNVLLGRHNMVAPDKRELVLQAVKELDYIPVRPVLQNRHQETRVIAMPMNDTGKIGWSINSGTYQGMCQAAMQHGYDVLMLLRPDPDWAAARSQVQLLDRRSDGIVFASPIIGESQDTFNTLARHSIPTIVCYRRDVPSGIAWVDPDNRGAMFGAVKHLVGQGHRKIAHLTQNPQPQHSFDGRERQRFFTEALHHFDLEARDEWMLSAQFFATTPDMAQSLVKAGVTAVVCMNDLLAIDLWKACHEAELNVPGDLSIIGVDGLEAEQYGLTSMQFSFADVGRLAVDGLVDLLCGHPVLQCCREVPVQLVTRRSVRRL